MIRNVSHGLPACALLVLATAAQAQGTAGNTVSVPFSDPSRPGTVRVNVITGSVTVRAASGRDVIVTTSRGDDADRDSRNQARGRERTGDDPAAGLHRLTQPAGVNIEEENNIVNVSSPAMMGRVNVDVQVPASTSLVVHAVNGGTVSVQGVNGSIEVNNVNGSIRLADVGGPVVAHATNGKVVATLRQIAAGTPMAFTSFNGSVDVTVPASAKANLKLRSDRGDVYTDFDVHTTPPPSRPDSDTGRRDDGRGHPRDDRDSATRPKYRLETDRSVYGTINGGGPDFQLRSFNGDIYLRKAK